MTNVWDAMFCLSASLSLTLPHPWDNIISAICFQCLILSFPSELILFSLILLPPFHVFTPSPSFSFPIYSSMVCSSLQHTSPPLSLSYAAGGRLVAPSLVDSHWLDWISERRGRCAAGVKYTPPKYTSASLKYTSDRILESAGRPGQRIQVQGHWNQIRPTPQPNQDP